MLSGPAGRDLVTIHMHIETWCLFKRREAMLTESLIRTRLYEMILKARIPRQTHRPPDDRRHISSLPLDYLANFCTSIPNEDIICLIHRRSSACKLFAHILPRIPKPGILITSVQRSTYMLHHKARNPRGRISISPSEWSAVHASEIDLVSPAT